MLEGLPPHKTQLQILEATQHFLQLLLEAVAVDEDLMATEALVRQPTETVVEEHTQEPEEPEMALVLLVGMVTIAAQRQGLVVAVEALLERGLTELEVGQEGQLEGLAVRLNKGHRLHLL